ncbi:ATP-dependent RNA helicase DDX24 [Girardinichthys multiradiatus]|uniref:ATP-dependent RNA helicase DDX24 n=1 Tax=Girardinichthys multiradiatus TaxID=208333 RepID=UPI001FAC3662|nr:ATP-dependent RNA helicase DDX24 [Girardinichthys multiradiatus]
MKPKKGKTGDKRVSSVRRSFDMKGKWKPVELDPHLFSQEGLQDLICFEELTSYRLVNSGKAAKEVRKEKKQAKKREAEQAVEEAAEPAKKKKKKKKHEKVAANDPETGSCGTNKDVMQESEVPIEEDGENEKETAATSVPAQSSTTNRREKKKKKKKSSQKTEQPAVTEKQTSIKPPSLPEEPRQDQIKPPKKQRKNWTNAALSGSEEKNSDVSAWNDLFVPSAVLEALSRLGFTSPTSIQALALPSAIRDRMDILGAAETGSGKTLAFGIPMIHTILEWKNGSRKTTEPGDTEDPKTGEQQDDSTEPSEEDDEREVDQTNAGSDEDEQGAEGEDQDEQLGCVRVIDDAEFDFKGKVDEGQNQPLLGLVLTPTRELAVQVKHHIDAVAKYTDIQTAIVVGGMAQQKQRRMLKRRPEIIIATPGRLWDLIKERHPHLLNLRQLKCLVIDEADRMVERGHFEELESLLEMLNTTHFNPTRQTFVFSATLTMVHGLPSRVLQKKKKPENRSKLEILMEKVGIKSKPKVIDLTRKEATVESLTETQICCQKDEKDFYLYYFLIQYPGRTMVFANSIECIKRLTALLVILDCSPLALHANMHQKQRLKNLERFAERQNCVLLTTDVAARGLDIPDVQHVIHYQVPRTSETYVHRSGRTARATKEGLSLLLIGPDDVMNFKKISKTLGKDEDLSVFPLENRCMEAIKERVNLARKIEKIEFFNSKEKQHDSWFKQAAKALEVDLDDDLLMGSAREQDANSEQQKMVKGMKKHLKHLISQPIFKYVVKTKYPTKMGKLALANMSVAGMESALTRISGQKMTQKLKRGFSQQQKEQKQKKRVKKQA